MSSPVAMSSPLAERTQAPRRSRLFGALTLVAGLALCAMGAGAAQAERRVALVIGNSAYQRTAQLPNPRNDAQDVAAALRGLDFEVIAQSDLDMNGMRQALAKFERDSENADAALFYYAGHGMQFEGANYLMPVDAALSDRASVRWETVSVEQVRDAMAGVRERGTRIIMLDACRDNPLAEKLVASLTAAGRSTPRTRGLARVEQTAGMLVAYATQSNQIAEDGAGRNSPFAAAFLDKLREPGVEINSMLMRVASDVMSRTAGRQRPEWTISLASEFVFNQGETDVQAWQRVRASTDAAPLREFLARYPTSFLAEDARQRIVWVENQREAADRSVRDTRDREIRDRIAALQSQLSKPADPVAPPAQSSLTITPVAPVAPEPPSQPRQPAEQAPVAALTPPAASEPLGLALLAATHVELRRLGCFAAASDISWSGPATKKAMALYARQARLAGPPDDLTPTILHGLEAQRGRLCPSACTAAQAEQADGACLAKTCARGERLDAGGDCVAPQAARPRPQRERRPPAVVARPRAPEAPPRRAVAHRRAAPVEERDYVVPIPVEARRPRCIPAPSASMGIGFGPVRMSAPFGGCL